MDVYVMRYMCYPTIEHAKDMDVCGMLATRDDGIPGSRLFCFKIGRIQ